MDLRCVGVYLVTNPDENIGYVGQAVNCANRTHGHLQRGMHGVRFTEARLLEDCTDQSQEELGHTELKWIWRMAEAGWLLLNDTDRLNPWGGALRQRELHLGKPHPGGVIGGQMTGPKNLRRGSEPGRPGARRNGETMQAWLRDHPEVRSANNRAGGAVIGARFGSMNMTKLNAIRRRCDECGRPMSPGGMAIHQRSSGHVGWQEVSK